MPATTLAEFWDAEKTRIDALLTTARADAAAAAPAEAAATAALVALARQLQDARARVEAARKKLARIPLPADGDPILAEMRMALVDMRTAQARQVEADAVVLRLRAERLKLAAGVTALGTALADAKARAQAEQRSAARRQLRISAATGAPLKDLPAQASAALASFKPGATAKVEGDFPHNADAEKDFLTRVRARRALAAAIAAHAAAVTADALHAATVWEESTNRKAARSAALQREFDSKAAALDSFVDAAPRARQAQEQLEALANRAASPLTPAQHKELNTGDPALQAVREDMLKLLKAADDAQEALLQAQEEYARLLLKTQSENPGKTESELLASEASLAARKTAVDDAVTAVADARNAPDFLAHLAELKEWFVAVPDALWEQLDTLDAAVADLSALGIVAPATLASALASAETALVTHLQAVVNEQLWIATLAETLVGDEARMVLETDLRPQRQQAAERFVEPV